MTTSHKAECAQRRSLPEWKKHCRLTLHEDVAQTPRPPLPCHCLLLPPASTAHGELSTRSPQRKRSLRGVSLGSCPTCSYRPPVDSGSTTASPWTRREDKATGCTREQTDLGYKEEEPLLREEHTLPAGSVSLENPHTLGIGVLTASPGDYDKFPGLITLTSGISIINSC